MNIQPINMNNQVQFKSLELRRTINICTHKDLFKKKVRYMYKDSLVGRFIDWVKYTIYIVKLNRKKDIAAGRKPGFKLTFPNSSGSRSNLATYPDDIPVYIMNKIPTYYPEDMKKIDKAVDGKKVKGINTKDPDFVDKYFDNLEKNDRCVYAYYDYDKKNYYLDVDNKRIELKKAPFVMEWSEIKFTPKDEEYIKSFPTRKEQVARMLELIDKGRNINKKS